MGKPAGPGKPLSAKQARFVEEYLLDLNATQAAIRAGYSAKTAKQQGARLLTHVDVQAAIAAAKAARSQRTEITQDRVLAELAKIGFADIRKVLTDDGGLRNPASMDDETAGAVASIEVVTRRLPSSGEGEAEVEYIHKVKTWDKRAALETLLRHLSGKGGEDDAPPLNINISVREAVGDVRVTQPERASGDLPDGA